MKEFIDKITLGNFYDLIKKVPDNSVDLVVTDPPYVINAKSGGGIADHRDWLKNIHKAGLDTFNSEIFLREMARVLKVFNAYIFCSKDQLVEYITFARDRDYNWDILVLGKQNPIPTKNNKYLSDIEFIVFMREKGGACFNNLTGKEHYDKYRKIKMTSVKHSEYNHPTEKPIHIVQPLVEISSNKGDLVLDPFVGTGTTAVACSNLGRHFIAFEIDETFCEMAKRKLVGLPAKVSLQQTFFGYDDEIL